MHLIWLACPGLFALTQTATARSGTSNVFSDFENPPASSRALFRYWLPDASVDANIVKEDILEIISIGAGGVEFLPFYLYGLLGTTETPTDWSIYGFGTAAFQKIFQAALEATKEANGEMDFSLGASQGQGVPSIPNTPGLAVQLLAGNTTVDGGVTFNDTVPAPQQVPELLTSGLGFMHHLEMFGPPELVATIAIQMTGFELVEYQGQPALPVFTVNVSSAVDLTESVTNGSLVWTAPPDNSTWRIFTFWEAYTGQRSCSGVPNASSIIANGSWIVDHFSAAGATKLTSFFDQHVITNEQTRELISSVGGNAWEDSMEMLATLWWTPGFLSKFEAAKGYSLRKYLPLLYTTENQWGQFSAPYIEQYVDDSQRHSGPSVYALDYRSVLTQGNQEYIRAAQAWANGRGVRWSNQPSYNLPLDMARSIPLVDTPEAESLGFADNVDAYRVFSGPANLAGTKVISNEMGAVPSIPYTQTIPELLFHVKRAFAGGANRMVLHGSPYSGNYEGTTWPGYNAFFYRFTEMWNSIQPCWTHLKATLDFVGRTQHVLQSGVPKVDLAFYNYEAPFVVSTKYNSDNLRNRGYTYDFLGPDNFDLPSATVSNRVLASSGPGYKALIVQNQSTISAAAVHAFNRYAASGLPIIFVGPLPNITSSASESDQQSVTTGLARLMSSHPSVQQILSIQQLPDTLSKALITPRAQLQCGSGPVYTVWRSAEATATEYVFLYNDQQAAVDCVASLTTTQDATPHILNAWTGTSTCLHVYTRRTPSELQIPVHLAGNETRIIALTASRGECTSASVQRTSSNIRYISSRAENTLTVAVAGDAEVTTSKGHRVALTANVPSPQTLTRWDVEIESWQPRSNASERYNVRPQIELSNFTTQHLGPWSSFGDEYANVSGIGRYTTTFPTPGDAHPGTSSASSPVTRRAALLRLPPVQHTQQVRVNGHILPAADPVDPTTYLPPHLLALAGQQNEIEIEITTTLINQLRASAESLAFIGVPLPSLSPGLVNASVSAVEYGLQGPVEVEWLHLVDILV